MARKVTKPSKTTKRTPQKAKINDATAKLVAEEVFPSTTAGDSKAHENITTPEIEQAKYQEAISKSKSSDINTNRLRRRKHEFSSDTIPGVVDPLTFVWKPEPPPAQDPFHFPVSGATRPTIHAVTSMKEMFGVIYENVHEKIARMCDSGEWLFPWQELVHLSFYNPCLRTDELLSGDYNVIGGAAYQTAMSWTEYQRALKRWAIVLYRDSTRPHDGDKWFAVLEDDPLRSHSPDWRPTFLKKNFELGRDASDVLPIYDSWKPRHSSSGSRESAGERLRNWCTAEPDERCDESCAGINSESDFQITINRCGGFCG